MIPISEQEEFEFRLRAEKEAQASTPDKPGFIQNALTNISRPGAAGREGVRAAIKGGMDNENIWSDIGIGMKRGFMKPEESETFQQEDLRKYYGNEKPSTMKTTGGLGVSALGVAKDVASDPLTYAAGPVLKAVGKIPFKGLSLGVRASKLPAQSMLASVEGQTAKASREIPKAITATEQLLKPSDKEFARSIEKGVQYNPSEQAAKYISPSKNYTELTDQMRMAEGMPMEARALKYRTSKADPSRDHLNALDELMMKETDPSINPQSSSPASNNKLRNYQAIRTAEVDSLKGIPEEQLRSPEFWQKRKEFYQKQAQDAGAYTGNEKMSARAEAYRALAQGAQDKTYALDEEILALNLENAGLGTAKKRFSELAQVERGQAPPSLSKEVVESVRPSSAGSMAALFRKVSGQGYTDVPKLTKTISKSMGKAEKAQAMAELIASMKKPEAKLTYDSPLQLEGSSRKGLPPPRTRGNFSDVSSGPTINAEGRSFIQIPEVLESDKALLAEKYGVPQRYNVRDIIKESDIPRSTQPESEGLIMSKSRRKEIDSIMARRKRNFGG